MASYFPSSFFHDRDEATGAVAKALRDGSLVLFLGAGISMSSKMPFPGWVELVKRCCLAEGMEFDETKASTDYLLGKADKVEEMVGREGLVERVGKELYRGVSYDPKVMKADTLIGLGALAMNSTLRGAARTIISLNFDDLLEWYLEWHGFKVQIVSRIPTILRRADVTVFHPHGFLPLLGQFKAHASSQLVFGQREYSRLMAEGGAAWNVLIRSVLETRIALFVGFSGADPHLRLLVSYSNLQLEEERPVGFVILRKKEWQNEELQMTFKAQGLVAILVEEFDEIPDILLEVCQRARESS